MKSLNFARRAFLAASFALVASTASHADVAAAITTAQTDILAVVAAAGAALVAIAVAGVAWKVGGRWISRLGSHA